MKIVDPYPSERLIEAANLIHYLPGIKVKTRALVLEVSGIQNNDFEATISRTLSRDPPYKKEELVRIFEVIRLIDPILSEFKNKHLGENPQEYFVDFSDVVDGSSNEAGAHALESSEEIGQFFHFLKKSLR